VSFAADLRDLFFPPHCPGCGGALDPAAGGDLCAPCRRDLPQPEGALCPGCGRAAAAGPAGFCPSCRGGRAFDAVVFAAPYAGTARELVHRFKYGADFAAGRVLGRLLAGRVAEAFPAGVDLLVPVPLHRRRLCGRGFNQAALIARDLSRRLGPPAAVAALARSRSTRTLAGLGRRERAGEVGAAFAVRRPELVAGRRVLLVDDILTTGGSLLAMIPAVEAMGGEIVEGAVLVDRSGGRPTLTSPVTGRVYSLRALWGLDLPTYEPGAETCPRCADGTPLHAPGSTGAGA
jgi:ComF family protein